MQTKYYLPEPVRNKQWVILFSDNVSGFTGKIRYKLQQSKKGRRSYMHTTQNLVHKYANMHIHNMTLHSCMP